MPLGEDGESDIIYDQRKKNSGRPEGKLKKNLSRFNCKKAIV